MSSIHTPQEIDHKSGSDNLRGGARFRFIFHHYDAEGLFVPLAWTIVQGNLAAVDYKFVIRGSGWRQLHPGRLRDVVTVVVNDDAITKRLDLSGT